MRLGIRFLDDVISYNSFRLANEVMLTQGEDGFLYFQLVSIYEACAEDSMIRYIPKVTGEVNLVFLHIDSNKEIVRAATKAFPDEDRSIWKVQIQASDVIAPDSIFATLTEDGVTRRLILTGTLRSEYTDSNRFFC